MKHLLFPRRMRIDDVVVSEGEEEEEDKRKPYIDICQANRKDSTNVSGTVLS